MKKPSSIPIVVLLTVITTALLYNPVSILIFRVAEPSFGYPIKSSTGQIQIRNDDLGNGRFGAKRLGNRSHSGIDISSEIGAPVYASKSGVAFRCYVPTGYGKYVLIYHPDGTQTLYAHLSDWAVKTGKKVRKGCLIGYVGKTGNAANKDIQPHLHFEIRRDGDPEEPLGKMRE